MVPIRADGTSLWEETNEENYLRSICACSRLGGRTGIHLGNADLKQCD
jgi:hypothetical protein